MQRHRKDFLNKIYHKKRKRRSRRVCKPKGSKGWQRFDYRSDNDYPNNQSDFNALRSFDYKDRVWPSNTVLYRMLLKKVGQNWDSTWSDICQLVDRRTIVSEQIRHVIDRMVSTNGFPEAKRFRWSMFDFYVDQNGDLQEINHTHKYKKWRYDEQHTDDIRKISEFVEFRLIDNIWFEVKLKPVPENTAKYYVKAEFVGCQPWFYSKDASFVKPENEHFRDIVTGKSSRIDGTDAAVYKHKKYAYAKRQANKKTIKQFKLNEDK